MACQPQQPPPPPTTAAQPRGAPPGPELLQLLLLRLPAARVTPGPEHCICTNTSISSSTKTSTSANAPTHMTQCVINDVSKVTPEQSRSSNRTSIVQVSRHSHVLVAAAGVARLVRPGRPQQHFKMCVQPSKNACSEESCYCCCWSCLPKANFGSFCDIMQLLSCQAVSQQQPSCRVSHQCLMGSIVPPPTSA
jgi:hypothetical protein